MLLLLFLRPFLHYSYQFILSFKLLEPSQRHLPRMCHKGKLSPRNSTRLYPACYEYVWSSVSILPVVSVECYRKLLLCYSNNLRLLNLLKVALVHSVLKLVKRYRLPLLKYQHLVPLRIGSSYFQSTNSCVRNLGLFSMYPLLPTMCYYLSLYKRGSFLFLYEF